MYCINSLKQNGNYTYHLPWYLKYLHYAHALNTCGSYHSLRAVLAQIKNYVFKKWMKENVPTTTPCSKISSSISGINFIYQDELQLAVVLDVVVIILEFSLSINCKWANFGMCQYCVQWAIAIMNTSLIPLTPKDTYSGRTAPLTSKVAFYVFIQQI